MIGSGRLVRKGKETLFLFSVVAIKRPTCSFKSVTLLAGLSRNLFSASGKYDAVASVGFCVKEAIEPLQQVPESRDHLDYYEIIVS